MQRKSLEIVATDLAQAVGLLVRRVRAAAAGHELSLTESESPDGRYRTGSALIGSMKEKLLAAPSAIEQTGIFRDVS